MKALLRLVSLRHLAGEGLRTALTLLGVALGVGVLVAVRLANQSALGALAFEPPDPTACATPTGATTAGISGLISLGGA